jgi:uncharacterized DUF497 family protein
VPYLFEWDSGKAAANEREHGVAFDEATEAFGDPLSLNMPDPSHSVVEERYLVLGLSRQGRLLVVSYAERGPRTRLISARLASRVERRRYEEDHP